MDCRGVECRGMDCRRMDCKVMDYRGVVELTIEGRLFSGISRVNCKVD